MSEPKMTRADALRHGDLIDLEPLLKKYAPDDAVAILASESELAWVEAVAVEDAGPDRPAVLYTDGGNVAVARDELVAVCRNGAWEG